MNKIKIALLCLVIAAPLFGCSPKSGREFNTSYTSSIERGITTKTEILAALGEPQTITISEGGENWSYYSINYGNYLDTMKFVFGGTSKNDTETLEITFDGDIVKDFTFSQSR